MENKKTKIVIIGSGNVGSTYAFALTISGLAREIVMVDINHDKCLGECLDLNHGLSFLSPTEIYASDYSSCKNADLIVVTAGLAQKPGQSRLELIKQNAAIFKKIMADILIHNPNPLLLIVSNPVDILTYLALRFSQLPSHRVFGSGTTLDTSRLRFLVGQHCNVNAKNVHAYIIGEHGDTELAAWSHANIGGVNFNEFYTMEQKANEFYFYEEDLLTKLLDKVKHAAYEIIKYKGATYYAIALALVNITQAVVRNENTILPLSVLLDDYNGISDVCLSVPCRVNAEGISQVIKMNLSADEQKRLEISADTLRKIIAEL